METNRHSRHLQAIPIKAMEHVFSPAHYGNFSKVNYILLHNSSLNKWNFKKNLKLFLIFYPNIGNKAKTKWRAVGYELLKRKGC